MKRIIGLSLLFALAFLSISGAWAQCTAYSNSAAYPGNLATGGYCGYTGPGCTECISEWWGSGGSGFYTVCYFDAWGLYCSTWGAENQGF